ncbi:MAG: YebC/PmpR family DNA-binding transcriptional regulator [Anaerolineales bacterium]|nr:YebC/PmpR family DNA-binding transcriptional regulator [Anaerolineales bacterium]
MSGHSKWSTIKRKKAANDARRGSIFTRLAREITIAAREGGGDLDSNFALRLCVDRAKTQNMPKDNIERAIKRGTGEDKDGVQIEQVMYEGYGPNGIALLIETLTDNRNRTISDLRHLLAKAGGSMAEAGSVAWQFTRIAYFSFEAGDRDEDEVFELAVEAGADDVLFSDDVIEIFAPVEYFKQVLDTLQQAGIRLDEAELRFMPNTPMQLAAEKTAQIMKLIETIEDLDDIQNVFSNLEVTDEALELLETA